MDLLGSHAIMYAISSLHVYGMLQPKKKRQKGYTAYMLWCGTQRLKLMAVNPGIGV